MPDDLTATLAGKLAAWHSVMDAPVIPGAPKDWRVTELDAWFITTARTAMPVLLAAVEAVLAAHRPNTADGRCNWCREADGRRSAWPCGEYLTITRALNGENHG